MTRGGTGWTSGGDARRTSSPPPPPLPEHPERPLFADDPKPGGRASPAPSHVAGGDPGTFTGSQRSTGAGNGPVPAAWGPDAGRPPGSDQGWDAGRDEEVPGRSSLRLAVVLAAVLVVVVAAVFVFNLGRGSGSAPTAEQSPSGSPSASATTSSTKVPIAGVTDFDPQGTPPEEHPNLTQLAIDGKPGTAWQTMTYRGNPKLGGLKNGVGLLVDLGKPVRVGEVHVTLLGSPTSLEILAAPGAQAAPSSTDGLTTVARADNAGPSVDLLLHKPVTTQWFAVWLTSLPSAPGGYQGRVAEVSVRS